MKSKGGGLSGRRENGSERKHDVNARWGLIRGWSWTRAGLYVRPRATGGTSKKASHGTKPTSGGSRANSTRIGVSLPGTRSGIGRITTVGRRRERHRAALGGVEAGVTYHGARATVGVGTQAGFQGESAGVGVNNCVAVQFTGKGDAANLQNEMLCQWSVVSGQLSGEAVGGRLIGGDDLGACEPGGSDLGDGGGQEETCGRGDDGDSSGARDPRRSSDFVPLTLAGQEPETNIQNGIVGEEIGEAFGESQVEAAGDGDRDASETGPQTKGGGDDPLASSGEKRFVEPRRVSEPLSKRERRRRRREMANKERQGRRGAMQRKADAPLEEELDRVEGPLQSSG